MSYGVVWDFFSGVFLQIFCFLDGPFGDALFVPKIIPGRRYKVPSCYSSRLC